ncbi:MAG: L,D-carboxypeptidase A [Methanomassiliicoccales archaeon PtaU1.Bin124]|nr:MAG: L,D-carboxypeptidase A [Methanomassiliicoccales archaeon PtaU1.Bin124]
MGSSVFGGYNSNHLLDLLDYKAIKRSRKVFCGYSDVTALNTAILTISGLVNFSGPALVTFCQPELPKYTIDNFLAAVCSAEQHTVRASDLWAEDRWFQKPDLGPREWMANPGWTVLQEGTVDGETIGGNLNTLLALAGTDYWPEMHGRVLFIEEDDTGPAALMDRNLQQLRMMGVFDDISGLVVGRIPTRAGFDEKDRFEDAILAATSGYDMPIVTGVDLSHTDPLFTLPLGVGCRLDAQRKEITFHGAVE